MNRPTDPLLYEEVKKKVYKTYKTPSAYRSGALVKAYKAAFVDKYGPSTSPYVGSGEKPLKRWFMEEWRDVGNREYPVYRPTLRISEKTPLTISEISPSNLKSQIALKQKIKSKKNLPPFVPK